MGTPQRTSRHAHRHTHTNTQTHIGAHGLQVPPLRTTNPSRQWTWGRGLRKEVLPTGSACQASVRRGGIPRLQVGAPRASCGRGPFSPRGSAPGLCTRRFTVGSPTRAVLRDPETRPPDRAAGEADGGWALGPVALGRRVCLLNPLSTAWSELPFPGGRSSPDPEAGVSLLGVSVWPAHLMEQPREGQGSPSSGM